MPAPIRLERERPAARQAGGALAIGAVLTVLGGGILLVARNITPSAGDDEWLMSVVGGGFAAVGVVVLLLGFKMVLITRLPQTVLEVDRMPVRAGQAFQLTVRQPGPIRLESLRVNVVGEQVTRCEKWRQAKKRIETDRRLVHQHNIVDARDLAIARGNEFACRAEATVPAEVKLADIDGDKTLVWRLEVWGRVRGWVDFGHPFVITVKGVNTYVDS